MRAAAVVVLVVLLLAVIYVVHRAGQGACEKAADCPAGQACIGGRCAPPPGCGGGAPCVPPLTCVGGACAAPAGCGEGPPCASPQVCLGGTCVEPIGPCYAWAPLAPTAPVPANAVGAQTYDGAVTGFPSVPRGADGRWYVGGLYTDAPGSNDSWLVRFMGQSPAGGQSNWPRATAVYYLAAAPGCSLVPGVAASPADAVKFQGAAMCWDPRLGLLVPYVAGACYRDPVAALIRAA